MNHNLRGSSVHGVSQARIQAWDAISFPRGSSQTRDRTHVSCSSRQVLYHWIIREVPWPYLLSFTFPLHTSSLLPVKWVCQLEFFKKPRQKATWLSLNDSKWNALEGSGSAQKEWEEELNEALERPATRATRGTWARTNEQYL